MIIDLPVDIQIGSVRFGYDVSGETSEMIVQ